MTNIPVSRDENPYELADIVAAERVVSEPDLHCPSKLLNSKKGSAGFAILQPIWNRRPMQEARNQYEFVVQHSREIARMQSIQALLEWDQQTMLPAGGSDYRAGQISMLAGRIHSMRTEERFRHAVENLSADSTWWSSVSSRDQANVREIAREIHRQMLMPQSLVEALANATSRTQQIWIEARKRKDFKLLAPGLDELFSLKRQQADALAEGGNRYDALLEEYEPGVRTADLLPLFATLTKTLSGLVRDVVHTGRQIDDSILKRHFPVANQYLFSRGAAEKIGFDFERGRLDRTAHPFCTELGPKDVRITTRYDEKFFPTSFFGVLHEAGHGIYEQGLDEEQYGLPCGRFASFGIHESQSRLWENLVGRTEAFWKHFFPQAVEAFPNTLHSHEFDSFMAAINRVSPSLIRVEADEMTYNLHIAIRFQIEVELIDENLSIHDLPERWNGLYREYLEVTPPDDASGVLQDVHWPAGLVGYFPTYTLGTIYASQLYSAAEKSIPALAGSFSAGDFLPLRRWLQQHVFSWGQGKSATEIVETASGQKVSSQFLLDHLRKLAERFCGL